MKTVMNHSQGGGLLKMIRRTDPVTNGYSGSSKISWRLIPRNITYMVYTCPFDCKLSMPNQGDLLVDGRWLFEVGG